MCEKQANTFWQYSTLRGWLVCHIQKEKTHVLLFTFVFAHEEIIVSCPLNLFAFRQKARNNLSFSSSPLAF